MLPISNMTFFAIYCAIWQTKQKIHYEPLESKLIEWRLKTNGALINIVNFEMDIFVANRFIIEIVLGKYSTLQNFVQ